MLTFQLCKEVRELAHSLSNIFNHLIQHPAMTPAQKIAYLHEVADQLYQIMLVRRVVDAVVMIIVIYLITHMIKFIGTFVRLLWEGEL